MYVCRLRMRVPRCSVSLKVFGWEGGENFWKQAGTASPRFAYRSVQSNQSRRGATDPSLLIVTRPGLPFGNMYQPVAAVYLVVVVPARTARSRGTMAVVADWRCPGSAH